MKINTITGMICLLLSSCTTDYLHPEFKNAVSNLATTQKVTSLSNMNLGDIRSFIKQDDCFGYLTFMQNSSLNILDINTSKAVPVNTRGNRKRSLLQNLEQTQDGITTLDVVAKEMVWLPKHSSGGTRGEVCIPLPKHQLHFAASKAGDYIIATGNYKEGRYLLYSIMDSTSQYFHTYPTHPDYPDIDCEKQGIIYASQQIRVKPDQTRFVTADRYSGIINICHLSHGNITSIYEKVYHHPIIEIKNNGKGDIVYEKNNPLGFTDIAVNDDYIFTIYSGKTYRDFGSAFQQCNTLLQLDWNGEVIKRYELANAVSSISYDYTNNTLYALESGSQNIVAIALETL